MATYDPNSASMAQQLVNNQYSTIQGQMRGVDPRSAAWAEAAQVGPYTGASAATMGMAPSVNAAQIDFGAIPQVGNLGTAQAQTMGAAQLNNPSQQGTNLNGAFNDFIYGDQGANPYLQASLQRGADQAAYNFQNILDDQNTNFQENILGSIRSGAVSTGNMGSSRQGIAEGIAARELAKQQGRAAAQVGQDLNSAMIGAQSQNFQQGRQLGAGLTGALSGQQFGQSQYGAGLQQAANQTNAQLGTNTNIANMQANAQGQIAGLNATSGLIGQQAGLDQNASIHNSNLAQATNQANAGFQQQANMANAANSYGAALANAGFDQQANLANAGAQNNLGLEYDRLNATVQNQGIQNAGAMFNSMGNTAMAADQYDANNLYNSMAAIAPYMQNYTGGSSTSPLYSNPWLQVLGGAVGGSQLF